MKKIVLSVAGLFLLVLVAAFLFIATFDPNNYKERIIAEVAERAGLSLRLDGNIEMELYPWFSLTVDNVVVDNPAGFGTSPLASIEHAAFRARLLPMLRRNFEIDTVVLQGVDASLITDENGRSNWAAFTPESEADTAGVQTSSGMPFNDLRLGGVSIERINITYDDRITGNRLTVSDFRFATDDLVYGEPIDVDLGFSVTANNPALDADVNVTGVVNYDLDNDRYDIAPMQLVSELRGSNVPGGRATISLDTELHFDLGADSLRVEPVRLIAPSTELNATVTVNGLQSNAPQVETEIDLRGDDLPMLFRMAGVTDLASRLGQLNDRSFNLQSRVAAQPARGQVNLSNLQLNLLGTTVTGTVEAGNLNTDAPILRGELDAQGPNLPSVLEVIGQVTGGNNSKLAEGGRLMQQVPDKAFNINAQFDANLQRGTVDVPRLDMRVLGATVSGNVNAGALDSDEPNARGQLQASGPDLPLLMQIGGWFYAGEESPIFFYGSQLGGLQNKAFSLATTFNADLRTGAIDVSTLDASAFGLQAGGSFDAANINSNNGNVSGELSLSGSNLGTLLTVLEYPEIAEVTRSLAVNLAFSGTSNALLVNPARVELVLAGNRIPNSPATVALNASSRINVPRESLQVEQFTLTGLGLDTRGRITVDELFSTPTVGGNVEVSSFNLRRLLQQLNQPLPDTADETVLQAVSLWTDFRVTQGAFNLENLALQLDDTHVTGNLSLTNGAIQEWIVDVDVSTIDVDRYLAEPQPATTQSSGDTSYPIPVDTLRKLAIRGNLDIGQIQVTGISLSEVSASLEARDGRINLSPLRSNLYQGSFNGSMALDASGALPTATANINLQQVAMEPLMQDMMNSTYVSGRGSLQLDLRTSGPDTLALRQGLNGSGRINLEDGVLSGVDVASVLTQLETMIRSRRPGELNRGQQTAFESFTANLLFENGVVNSNDLLIKSPGFQITGRGTLLNLHDDSIAYNLSTTVDASTATRGDQEYDIGGYGVPIACSGTLAAPRCLPDGREILSNLLQNEIRDRVGDLLNRLQN
ncbi:MAG: AsmA family protein [Proteobacteria bacterium]|nr:AsmA family protein [Pseudomonadota bacterium]MDA0926636.1 AsmA family protein [Pseudomonadota bacterium]